MSAAAAVLAIVVAAGEAQSPLTTGLLATATESLGPGTSIRLLEARDPTDADALRIERDLGAGAVVTLVWKEPAHLHASIRLHVARTNRWTTRAIAFLPGDTLTERGRTLGLAVGSMWPETPESISNPTARGEPTPRPPAETEPRPEPPREPARQPAKELAKEPAKERSSKEGTHERPAICKRTRKRDAKTSGATVHWSPRRTRFCVAVTREAHGNRGCGRWRSGHRRTGTGSGGRRGRRPVRAGKLVASGGDQSARRAAPRTSRNGFRGIVGGRSRMVACLAIERTAGASGFEPTRSRWAIRFVPREWAGKPKRRAVSCQAVISWRRRFFASVRVWTCSWVSAPRWFWGIRIFARVQAASPWPRFLPSAPWPRFLPSAWWAR